MAIYRQLTTQAIVGVTIVQRGRAILVFKEIDMRRVLIIAAALAITLVAWAVMARYVTGCYTAICK